MHKLRATRPARIKSAALAGSSPASIALVLKRAALVGGVGTAMLAMPGNPLRASDLAASLQDVYRAAVPIASFRGGEPVVKVTFAPAVAEASRSRAPEIHEGEAGQILPLSFDDNGSGRGPSPLERLAVSVEKAGLVTKEYLPQVDRLLSVSAEAEAYPDYRASQNTGIAERFGKLVHEASAQALHAVSELPSMAGRLALEQAPAGPTFVHQPRTPERETPSTPIEQLAPALADRRILDFAREEAPNHAGRPVALQMPPVAKQAELLKAIASDREFPTGRGRADPIALASALTDTWIIREAQRAASGGLAPPDGSLPHANLPDLASLAAGMDSPPAGPPPVRFEGAQLAPKAPSNLSSASGPQNIIVSREISVAPEPDPGQAAMQGQDPAGRIRLATLVDLLADHFEPEELRRLHSSPAINDYVSLDDIARSGIPVTLEPVSATLGIIDAAALQSADSGGGSQSGTGADLSSLASGWTQSLDASASLGFDSNPFLSDRQSPEVASFRLQLAPTIERATARTTIRATGRLQHVEYLGNYRSLQNFGADVSAAHRLTERLDVNAGVLFRSDILATDLTNPLITEDTSGPTIPTIPGGNDVTVLGQRQRREQYGADVGLKFRPSDRDDIRWSAAFRADRYASRQLSDSDFYTQQLRYSRQLNGAIGIGAVVNASIIDFTNAAFGDTQTITPQALVTVQLSERLSASGSVGVAISRVELATGNETSTSLAGNLSLCRQGSLSQLCVTGSRQVLPSAIGGARVQTTGGLSYSLRLSERDSVQLGGNYSTASQPIAATGGNFESINAFGRYERRLNERMRLNASVGYLDTSGNNRLEASNFQALVGVSISLGRGK